MPGLRRSVRTPRLLRARLLRSLATVLLAGLLVAGAAAPADSGVTVRIISPDTSDILLGKTEIILSATPPEGGTILKIEIFVDDELIGTLLDPPYRLVWDAGDVLGPRTVRVRAYGSDGSRTSDRVRTRSIVGAQRANVTLVEVYATVRDQQGRYVDHLKKEDFTILDSGRPQEIAVFSSDRKPVHLVLLFDASNSMNRGGKIELARQAAIGFIKALEPGDTAALIAFNDAPRIIREDTDDKKKLEQAVESIEARGGTAMYDAIAAGVDVLKVHEGHKAIILLSDGRDESSDGIGPGSIATYEEVLDKVLEAETVLYAVGTGAHLEKEFDYYHRHRVGEILGTLAGRSGGRAYLIKKASKLKRAYAKIADELRHQYTLAYYPPRPARPAGKHDRRGRDWHPIEVRVSRPRSRVTARAGYFAR